MGPISCTETSVRNYHHSLVIAQKSAVLIYLAAEAWNHAYTKVMDINFILSTLQVRLCLQPSRKVQIFMKNTLCPSTLSRRLV